MPNPFDVCPKRAPEFVIRAAWHTGQISPEAQECLGESARSVLGRWNKSNGKGKGGGVCTNCPELSRADTQTLTR